MHLTFLMCCIYPWVQHPSTCWFWDMLISLSLTHIGSQAPTWSLDNGGNQDTPLKPLDTVATTKLPQLQMAQQYIDLVFRTLGCDLMRLVICATLSRSIMNNWGSLSACIDPTIPSFIQPSQAVCLLALWFCACGIWHVVMIRTYTTWFLFISVYWYWSHSDSRLIFLSASGPIVLLTHAQLAVVTQSCTLLYIAAHCDLLF